MIELVINQHFGPKPQTWLTTGAIRPSDTLRNYSERPLHRLCGLCVLGMLQSRWEILKFIRVQRHGASVRLPVRIHQKAAGCDRRATAWQRCPRLQPALLSCSSSTRQNRSRPQQFRRSMALRRRRWLLSHPPEPSSYQKDCVVTSVISEP